MRVEVVFDDEETNIPYYYCGKVIGESEYEFVEDDDDSIQVSLEYFVKFDNEDREWIDDTDEWRVCTHVFNPDRFPKEK